MKVPPGFTGVLSWHSLTIAFHRKHRMAPYPGTHNGNLDTFIWKVASIQVEHQFNKFMSFTLWGNDLTPLIYIKSILKGHVYMYLCIIQLFNTY